MRAGEIWSMGKRNCCVGPRARSLRSWMTKLDGVSRLQLSSLAAMTPVPVA